VFLDKTKKKQEANSACLKRQVLSEKTLKQEAKQEANSVCLFTSRQNKEKSRSKFCLSEKTGAV
jgi:hypothetical protein